MDPLRRNNVTVSGAPDGAPMVFAHGFGCDQGMWRHVAPAFEATHRVVLFDHVGAGGSDLSAYDPARYSRLEGYAADVVELLEALALPPVVLVAHSVSAMIGMLAAAERPELFDRLVLVGPSPRYVDDEGYRGGFSQEEIDELLDTMDGNYLGWSQHIAPVVMGTPDRPELGAELTSSFCRSDPVIARRFARTTFLSDNRADLSRVRTPSLVVQCRDDAIAPTEVGEYVHRHLAGSDLVLLDATGHCPNLSAPERAGGRRAELAAGGVSTGRDWDDAPCGLLTLRLDGTVLAANRTFLGWLGRPAEEVVERVRLAELLSVGGRIYWETHLSPLLHVDRRLDEVAVELKVADGRLPVLVSAVVADQLVRVSVSSARERSRYERELLAARTAAERSAEQVRALQRVTAALSQALGVPGVADALLTAAVGVLGASAASLWLADATGALVLHGASGEPPGAAPALPGAEAAVDDGRVVVPLHGAASLQGLLSVLAREGGGADALDLEVLALVGLQAGLALDRAQLHQQSAEVAHELQHSLLAVEPPVDPRFAVATAYRPGVEQLDVGGDWYDVFLVEEGLLAVVVGDVVGRGLAAASAMGQLRSAVRAVAAPGLGPAGLLSRLDRFVEQVEAAGLATLAYAELELATGLLTYACAGHPPPVLLPAGGEPELLWGGRSTPLGAFLHPERRSEAQLRLGPEDRLLLYTDGLVERRDRALDDSLEVLRTAAVVVADAPLTEAVRTLVEVLLRDEQGRDDVCVLLLSWGGQPFARQLAADLRDLASVRHALGRWLTAQGVGELDRWDLVLATSEVVANAAEHGLGGQPSRSVDVTARLEQRAGAPDEVVLQVRDDGTWREPVRSAERGRGLGIARQLVDDVAVETGTGTTVVLRRRVVRAAP